MPPPGYPPCQKVVNMLNPARCFVEFNCYTHSKLCLLTPIPPPIPAPIPPPIPP